MTERFYELAGIRYRFLIPADCPWDTVRTLNGYITQPGIWDVMVLWGVPSVSAKMNASASV